MLLKKIILSIFLIGIAFLPPIPQQKIGWLKYDPTLFQSGDIIFRRGKSLISQIVLTADEESSFSHAGLIERSGDSLFVIHIIPNDPQDGGDLVRRESLQSFLRSDHASLAAVYRLQKDDQQYAQKATTTAKQYFAQHIKFDRLLDLETLDKLYCTELIWQAYNETGIDLVDGKWDHLSIPFYTGNYILPSGLLKSPHLQQIAVLDSLTFYSRGIDNVQ